MLYCVQGGLAQTKGLQIKLSNIHAPGGVSQDIHGVDIPTQVSKGASNRARAAEELQHTRHFF